MSAATPECICARAGSVLLVGAVRSEGFAGRATGISFGAIAMSVRHAILGVLKSESMHGYQIATELEGLVAAGRYNSAQIYHGLQWLDARGFVVAQAVQVGAFRDRRPFSITAAGRREFERWLREPIAPARPVRDDTLIKLVFLCRDSPAQLIPALERLQRFHLRRLARAKPKGNRDVSKASGESLPVELSAAALRFREQAELRWIEYCLLRLRPLANDGNAEAGKAGTSLSAVELQDTGAKHEKSEVR